ncbi:hypothetical protein Tco_0561472 [Tanacetum coccineum]
MIAYLEKTDGNAEFHEIMDFLTRSSIHYALTVKDEGEALERPSESQPIPYPSHPSEDQPKSQPDPSPRPSPFIPITDSNPEGSGRNHGGQSSSDKSLSGNEDGLTLQREGKLQNPKPTAYKDQTFDVAFDDLDATDYMETKDTHRTSIDYSMGASHSMIPIQASVRDSFSCWEKARISPRSRLKKDRGKNRLMKAVRSSSHVSVVPSLSSSNHVFASPVVSFNCKFICGFRNGDCREGGQSDNTVGSPHEFIIHGIEIFKGNEKVTEVTDVENCQIDNSRTLRRYQIPTHEELRALRDRADIAEAERATLRATIRMMGQSRRVFVTI